MVDFAKKTVAKAITRDATSSAQNALGIEDTQSKDYPQSPIVWTNYNFPPLLRLAHYSTVELKNPVLRTVKMMHAAAILIIVVQVFNRKYAPLIHAVINTFVLVSVKYSPGVHVVYSLLSKSHSLTFFQTYLYSQFLHTSPSLMVTMDSVKDLTSKDAC